MSEISELTVVSCNVLLDGREKHPYEPQQKRLHGILDLVAGLEPDVVSLYEVGGQPDDHPGAYIADRLGLTTHAFHAYGLRQNEGIVTAATADFKDIECLELDPKHMNRVAHVAHYRNGEGSGDDFAVVGTHPSHHVLKGIVLRRRQMNTLLENISGYDQAVVMGDLNAMPWQKSRRMLEKAGFNSALGTLGHPPTYPTDAQKCDIGAPKLAKPIMRAALQYFGVSLDDIYVRGGKIVDAGLLESEDYEDLSDHYGVWATIRWGSGTNS
jgi:endonuclease/exonuclease/phosphatase family metal-dependent hydrolase